MLQSCSIEEVVEVAKAVIREEHRDPVCGVDLGPEGSAFTLEHEKVVYEFCSARCKEAFRARPSAYVRSGLVRRVRDLWAALTQDAGGGGRCC